MLKGYVNPIQDGLFRGCSRMGRRGRQKAPPSLKSVTHILQWWIPIFSPEISKFCYIKKYRCRFLLDKYFLTLLTFLESLRFVLINMVKILMMSTKVTTQGLLKIKIFWKKAFEVIISAHDVINTILSRNSNHNVNVVMWPKFSYSSISVREAIIYAIL